MMFGLTKKMFIRLLTSIVSASNCTKTVSLNNEKCMTLPTRINLYPNQDSQELHYYPFAVNLDRYAGSCKTLDDLSSRLCAPDETRYNLACF